jgi:hypothetical protein
LDGNRQADRHQGADTRKGGDVGKIYHHVAAVPDIKGEEVDYARPNDQTDGISQRAAHDQAECQGRDTVYDAELPEGGRGNAGGKCHRQDVEQPGMLAQPDPPGGTFVHHESQAKSSNAGGGERRRVSQRYSSKFLRHEVAEQHNKRYASENPDGSIQCSRLNPGSGDS